MVDPRKSINDQQAVLKKKGICKNFLEIKNESKTQRLFYILTWFLKNFSCFW